MAKLIIRSPEELRRIARGQIREEVRSETRPLERQRKELMSRRQQTLQDISRLYGTIQPAVESSAGRVGAFAQQTTDAVRGVFDEAQKRISALQGSQVAKAQDLAQTVGGPVPVDLFTEPIVGAAGDASRAGAGELLETLSLGQADVGQAEAFAGRVFPLLQREDRNRAIADSEEKIAQIQDEIGSVQAGEGGRFNKRYNELLTKEREDELAQEMYKLESLKADRDYDLGKKSAAVAAGQLGVQRGQLAEDIRSHTATEALTRQQLIQEGQQNYVEWRTKKEEDAWDMLDTMAGGGGVVTVTEPHYVPNQRAESIKRKKPDARLFFDDKTRNPETGKMGIWYLEVDAKRQVGANIEDNQAGWDAAYSGLVGAGVPADVALSSVRAYFAQPTFQPSKPSKSRGLPVGKPPPGKKKKKKSKAKPNKTRVQ